MKKTLAALAVWAALSGSAAADENWPQWRGPSLDGTSNSTGLPVAWSETENVKWKVKMPSWSGSTPVIWGDRIFVPSASELVPGGRAEYPKKMGGERIPEGVDLMVLCLSKKDGKELWRHTIKGANYQIGKQNMSSPSCVTDGELVWWLTGTGILTALTMEGKEVWKADLQKSYGKFGLNWGYGASPLLHEGLVIVPVLHGMTTDDPSYLVAFEAKTGKVVWRVERPTDSPNEGPDAYTTPLPMKVGGQVQIVMAGGDYVTGHDPKTGKELWRSGGYNPKNDKFYRGITSPGIAGENVVWCVKHGPAVAFKAGGQGLVTQSNHAWTSADITFDVPTPVSDGKVFYILGDKGFLSCVDAATGKPVYAKQRVGAGTYSASPLLADGKIYMTTEDGKTTVVAAGPEFKVLAENKLDDKWTLSSFAVSGSNLFIRTSAALYCIGK
jgi:outer membrane protein assembly factor BamB